VRTSLNTFVGYIDLSEKVYSIQEGLWDLTSRD
jgi:hypothetical protein